MINKYSILLLACVLNSIVYAQDKVVDISGTSIIGNKELPKSLFIVPWKNAEVGDSGDLSDTLGESMTIVDREVFLREIQYYDFLQSIDN